MEIRQGNGWLALLKSAMLYIFYSRTFFYLYQKPVKADYSPSEYQPKVNTSNLRFAVVTSNLEADRLEREGFFFRSYPTVWNKGSSSYSKWLDKGVIAFCTFLNKELVAINWAITSTKVQKRVTYPLKVNYSEGEAYPRGAWAHPEYRRLGLMRYNFAKRDQYLSRKGIKLFRSTLEVSNKDGKGMIDGLGGRPYGKATMVRILWWKFWKETYNN